jgi:hypothetical protein
MANAARPQGGFVFLQPGDDVAIVHGQGLAQIGTAVSRAVASVPSGF